MEIVNKYLDLLWNQFQYDLNVFSQPWMYYWILIPAIFYFVFFWFKWIVLTLPIWLPMRMTVSGLSGIIKMFVPTKKGKS